MRIWFNHWFSTAYHLINLIQKGSVEKHFIIGSSTNPTAIYKRSCDEWYPEYDGLSAEQYIDFCLDFCREHEVEVFVPRRFLVDIVRNAERFSELGVKLFADTNASVIEILDDKIATYDYFGQRIPEIIPEIRMAHSLEEFVNSYEYLKDKAPRVCYKLAVDEGARSFRVIDNNIEQLSALLAKPGAKITWAAAQNVLREYDFKNPMLLMPYLSGVEISADCLKTPNGNLVIPRYKTNKRYSEIIFNEEVIALCGKIMDMLGLTMPMNIQFKKENDKLYLLEINPRMSGGLQLSCMASGINLPSIAMKQLLGEHEVWSYPDIPSQKVAHIETPICLY